MRLVRDRFAVNLLAALLAMVGVVAFYYPIHLGDYDPWGRQIPCGTAIAPDAGQAVEADMYTANPPRPGSAATPTPVCGAVQPGGVVAQRLVRSPGVGRGRRRRTGRHAVHQAAEFMINSRALHAAIG